MIDILLSPGLPFSFKLFQFFFVALSLLVALVIHEFAHGWMADKLGDPTARHQGRLSLNPLAHLDPLGTLAILLTGFGWGKPVLFDPFNLKNPRRDAALIGLAGPLSNLLLAIVCGILLHIFSLPLLLTVTLISIVQFNLMLGIFNLIPIHPLDGGKILIGFLPRDLAYEYNAVLSQYGLLILLFLVFPFTGTSPVSLFLSPILRFLMNILIP